jgi:N-acetylneuraminic acid mutarotase
MKTQEITPIMKLNFNFLLAILILCGLLGIASIGPAEEGPWTKKADMPTERGWLSTSEINGKIYAIVGAQPNVPLSTVEEYDPATDTWTKKKDIPTGRWGLSTSVVNGKIYVIGGTAGRVAPWGSLTTVEEYDLATDSWRKRTDMQNTRYGLSTSVVNGWWHIADTDSLLLLRASLLLPTS